MSEAEFLRRLGFDSNPFQYTDADLEVRLPDYFVAPPYFPSVFGDPDHPTSAIVFAPRGSGKSAQRRMVELQCPPESVLCITYDTFAELSPEKAAPNEHLRKIARLTLIGVLTQITNRPGGADCLTDDEKKIVQLLANHYLDTLGQREFAEALDALKNLPEKAKEFWRENFWLVNSVAGFALTKLGIPLQQPRLGDTVGNALDPSPTLHLALLGKIAAAAGLRSVYVLIDKVDETPATTNNPEAAYALISPLARDLRTLSTAPYGFKFFLPDTLGPFHRAYGRPDRIPQFELKWNWEDLREILLRRLSAHSGGAVTSDYELVDPESGGAPAATPEQLRHLLEDWIYKFAHGSPRDLIRIWQHIVAEQLRADPNAARVSIDAIFTGLDQFCAERTLEIVPPKIWSELQRVGRLDFTTNFVANDVFKIEANSARNKIRAWTDTGVVVRQADRQMKGARRPVYHYAIEDLRVARTLMSEYDAFNFWMTKVYECDACPTVVIRDWDRESSHVCRGCGSQIDYEPDEP
ncbi:MAG TPA: hypothetical protein VEZ14_05795 [Dehalococcoidia bacterium]|nr:hypothetical protein [Dehalococcoidia bacterium]